MINIALPALCLKLRTHARSIIFCLFVAFLAGIFPDAISHGIILPGRGGHDTLAVIGLFLITGGCCWLWFSRALYRRYGAAGGRNLALVKEKEKDMPLMDKHGYPDPFNWIRGNTNMVECLYYDIQIPENICHRCGRCK